MAVPASRMADSFVSGTSGAYLEELERQHQQQGSAVDGSWAGFFRALDAGLDPGDLSAAYSQHATGLGGGAPAASPAAAAGLRPAASPEGEAAIRDSMNLMMLVLAYQEYGHKVRRGGPPVRSRPTVG